MGGVPAPPRGVGALANRVVLYGGAAVMRHSSGGREDTPPRLVESFFPSALSALDNIATEATVSVSPATALRLVIEVETRVSVMKSPGFGPGGVGPFGLRFFPPGGGWPSAPEGARPWGGTGPLGRSPGEGPSVGMEAA